MRGANSSGGRGLKEWTFEPCNRVGFVVSLEVPGNLLGTVNLFTRATSLFRRRLHPNLVITVLRNDSLVIRKDLRLGGCVTGASGCIASSSASGGHGEGAKLLGDRAGSGLGRIPALWSSAAETTGVPIRMPFLAAASASAASHRSGNSEEASG